MSKRVVNKYNWQVLFPFVVTVLTGFNSYTELHAHWFSMDLLSAIAVVRSWYNRVLLAIIEQTTSCDSQRSFMNEYFCCHTPFYKSAAFPAEAEFSYRCAHLRLKIFLWILLDYSVMTFLFSNVFGRWIKVILERGCKHQISSKPDMKLLVEMLRTYA